uniref:Uncharacterized protein n=1 Tax=Parascaris equorum TaxID=6256 RepID=A0A914RUQ4_PAREQ
MVRSNRTALKLLAAFHLLVPHFRARNRRLISYRTFVRYSR